MNAFDLIFHLLYVFWYFEHSVSLKTYDKKNIDIFLMIFTPILWLRGPISGIFFFTFDQNGYGMNLPYILFILS